MEWAPAAACWSDRLALGVFPAGDGTGPDCAGFRGEDVGAIEGGVLVLGAETALEVGVTRGDPWESGPGPALGGLLVDAEAESGELLVLDGWPSGACCTWRERSEDALLGDDGSGLTCGEKVHSDISRRAASSALSRRSTSRMACSECSRSNSAGSARFAPFARLCCEASVGEADSDWSSLLRWPGRLATSLVRGTLCGGDKRHW